MNLKLIGIDSRNGMKIIKIIERVERKLKISFNLDKIKTCDKNKYNVNVIPTLILDDKIISEGNVITDRELKNIVKPMLEEA